MSKTILVTGASRGLGLACTRILVEKFGANVVTLSRSSPAGLTELQSKHAGKIETVQGDVVNEADQKVSERL